jgi:hypothetical protein
MSDAYSFPKLPPAPFRIAFDGARDPYVARNALGIHSVSGAPPPFLTDAPSNGRHFGRYNATWADLDEVYMRWVPYTSMGQAFLKQDLTRDGDWTMVAVNDTTDRPAPQPTGAEEDLLPIWTPATASNPANHVVYNEWTVNTAGWLTQYGMDVLNPGKQCAVTLQINGVTKDTFTVTPNTAGLFWNDITPVLVASGAVIRVTNSVSGSGSLSWYQQVGLFASAPVYCSSAVGSKDGAAAGTTAYGCHAMFQPGTKSANWDVVAFGGSAAGGGGGGGGPAGPGLGVTDGSNASPGYIGEYLTATRLSGSPLSVANNTMTAALSLALTAGDWDATAISIYKLSATPTVDSFLLEANLITTSAGTADVPNYAAQQAFSDVNATWSITLSSVRFSSASAMTAYLNVKQTCGAALNWWGSITARRMR